MAFDTAFTYDVFITHAWRFHDDWNRVGATLDGVAGFKWRNFSVPWYDPAMDPNTPVGSRFVHDWLESQILPCHVVVYLESVYAVKSARKWVDIELEMARTLDKPVIAISVRDAADLADVAGGKLHAVVSWDGAAIADAIASAIRS